MKEKDKVEEKKYRGMRIDVVRNGFIVQIGCQLFVYSSARNLARDFAKYMKDPQEMEKDVMSKSLLLDTLPQPVASLKEPIVEELSNRPNVVGGSNDLRIR